MYELIDGKKVAEHIKQQVKTEIELMDKEVTLAVIVVGDNPASRVYVNNKKKACEYVGIKSAEVAMPEDVSEDTLFDMIDTLNYDQNVHGILVQLPLPKHIDEKSVLERIWPDKDVDGFSAYNTGKLWQGQYDMAPCTAMGIIELLDYYNINVSGKHCVIVGRSNIVGKPVAALLLERNATVTICHSKTKNLSEITSKADILISAVGNPKFITWGLVKKDAVVIDVGINRDENGKLCGDVDAENIANKASLLTPVPGGVGPMTVAMLMKNTLIAARNQLAEN
jgi:methylenetetrahydrofolate dehydrogenase (NADP+)/methenyltetrahydrofolate cyclohydrolase